MTSKLDILAQKEEELRKINEQLDLKNDKIMSGALEMMRKEHNSGASEKKDEEVEDSYAEPGDADAFKGQLMKAPADDEDEDDYDMYENDGFEESKNPGSMEKISGKAADLGYNFTQGKGNPNKFGLESSKDEDLQNEMFAELKRKYIALEQQSHEQDKTVNFQKAKIAALQTELEESLTQMAENQTKLDIAEKQSGTKEQQDKKMTDKLNSLNLQVTKSKSTITEQQTKIASLEKALKDTEKELHAGERA